MHQGIAVKKVWDHGKTVGDHQGQKDIQKIDMGIALCHFVMGLKELGKQTVIGVSDPGISIPEDAEYIASVKLR